MRKKLLYVSLVCALAVFAAFVVGVPNAKAAGEIKGSLDGVTLLGPDSNGNRSVSIWGWALYEGSPNLQATVELTENGNVVATQTANEPSADVAAIYPGHTAHRFGFTRSVAIEGRIAYCVNVRNGGTLQAIGCKNVVIAHEPFGSLDGVVRSEGTDYLRIHGWAIDPDRPQSYINVHIFVDGQFEAEVPAWQKRTDVGAAYPGTGESHGIETVIVRPKGNYSICAYAIDVDALGNRVNKNNTQLGCKDIHEIETPKPSASLDVEQLAQDTSWQNLSASQIVDRVKAEYETIKQAMYMEFGSAADTMIEIAWCESNFGTNPQAYSGNVLGIFQVMAPDYQLVNPYYSIKVSVAILERRGFNPWEAYTTRVRYGNYCPHVFTGESQLRVDASTSLFTQILDWFSRSTRASFR